VDPTLVHAVYLLANLPDAAKSKDAYVALSELGINVAGPLTAASIAEALGEAVDMKADGLTAAELVTVILRLGVPVNQVIWYDRGSRRACPRQLHGDPREPT
jgi:hypothetical protein